MPVSESVALAVLSVSSMKAELRIPPTETSQDALLTAQIISAVSFVSESTGRAVTDLAGLEASIVSAVRQLYDGLPEVTENAAHNAWLDPFRSYKAG